MFNNYDRTKSNNRFNLHAQFGIAISLMVLAQVGLACRIMGEQSHEFYVKFIHGMLGHTLVICSRKSGNSISLPQITTTIKFNFN